MLTSSSLKSRSFTTSLTSTLTIRDCICFSTNLSASLTCKVAMLSVSLVSSTNFFYFLSLGSYGLYYSNFKSLCYWKSTWEERCLLDLDKTSEYYFSILANLWFCSIESFSLMESSTNLILCSSMCFAKMSIFYNGLKANLKSATLSIFWVYIISGSFLILLWQNKIQKKFKIRKINIKINEAFLDLKIYEAKAMIFQKT